jgi:hypothetical protein
VDEPIACTLDRGAYRARLRGLAAFAQRALQSRERSGERERLTFDGSRETERELREIVAAEAQCCPFLRMDISRVDDRLVLEIAAPSEARPIVEALFASGSGPAGTYFEPGPRHGTRSACCRHATDDMDVLAPRLLWLRLRRV